MTDLSSFSAHVLLDPNITTIFFCFSRPMVSLAAAMKGMQLGLLIGYEGDNQDAFPEVFDVAVVVEENIVLHNFKDVPSSFTMLLGIIYCVNLEYPRAMKYSFEFLQKVVMKIKPDEASARVHGVRNKLLRYKL